MEQAYVNIKVNQGVGMLEFHHPKSNSLPSGLLNEIANEISALSSMKEVQVIVIRSSGKKAFCAGASFDELLSISNETEGESFFSGFAKVIQSIFDSDKLVIAAIQGKTVGGGVGLAAACDFVIASDGAAFKLSELSIGIGPFVIGPAVINKIGKSAFTHMTYNPTSWFNAEWALNNHLVNKIVASNNLEEEVLNYSLQLAKYNPDAMLLMKRMVLANKEVLIKESFKNAKLSGQLVLSDFTKSKLQEFKSK